MPSEELLEIMIRAGVVPVVALDSPDKALPLAEAILEGGLSIVEITFRTAAAAETIRRITEKRPELIVGAGTVLTIENLEEARRSGARFAVAPGLNPQTVERARELGIPFIPGVSTAGEIERALASGCRLLKFFPAEPLGGPAMLKALYAPFAHTGVRFMPTGGVTAQNLEAWLQTPPVAAVGGTWLTPAEALRSGNWDEIRARARQAAEQVAKIRGEKK
ncbi:MAG: bifunctional 4-hydroxy-2-oxoglutarate aldolase/2-dehydro-3-deoxy-phosphogluconate aldolase [Pirellulales bacterium]|nr:bifunctional 4-hydroxy-2-oxoglutarate aldolase/2-dehydro-3-deoxy-phosphogluconate aldolase [Pirellulales bacterium]